MKSFSISWNKKEPFIVSGGDDGVIKVWDLRRLQEKKAVAQFKHHSGPITSVEWCPQDSSVFAASGEDNQITQVNPKKLSLLSPAKLGTMIFSRNYNTSNNMI